MKVSDLKRKIRVCRVATVPFALLGSKDHLEKLEELGCELTIVCSPGENFKDIESLKVSRINAIEIPREISPLRDLKAIFELYLFFKRNKFDLIHSNTPKGGLLVSIAGFLARTAPVVHTYTGQRWSTLSGFKKSLLYFCDWLIFKLNYRCFTDSPSQRDFLISKGIGKKGQLECIHYGAFAGINIKRFNSKDKVNKQQTLSELGFSENDFILLFVGRLVGDKGVAELVHVFKELSQGVPRLKLLLVGPIELAGDPLPQVILDEIKSNESIVSTGLQLNPEKYMSISDLFCLPSYREGFPTVVLEAAALKVPSIVTNIVGSRDTIIDGETGILVKSRDCISLKKAIHNLMKDENKIQSMGENAQNRVLSDFTLEVIAQKNMEKYNEVINEKTL